MSNTRLRTIRESVALIKAMDSDTAVTYNFISRLCQNKRITSITLGKKVLLNYDELLQYLKIEPDMSNNKEGKSDDK